MVIMRVQNGLLFLTEGCDKSIMPLFSIFGFLLQGVFQSLNLPQILSLLQLDSVSFQVGLLDTSFALIGQILDGLFPLFVDRHLLLLVLQQGDQMVVFLCSCI